MKKALAAIDTELKQVNDGVPHSVYRALAVYVFEQFKAGRPPLDLMEGELNSFDFVVGMEERQDRKPVTREEVDFEPIMKWFAAHPDTEVESVEVWPQSGNGRAWMNIKTTDGFYIRVSFIAYQLVGFGISENPLPWE